MSKDKLGDRMKNYEEVWSTKFVRRTPVVIRLDGKAFHTFTKTLEDRFDEGMHQCMIQTMEYLCKNIQNVVLGYTQSDEITLVMKDWTDITTEAWFDNKQSKIESVSASMATAKFNQLATQNIPQLVDRGQMAMFDSRAFNIPKEEVTNCLLWRQQDASRNSVQMLARMYHSHKELQNKKNAQIQDMLMLGHGINWNDLETWKKRGTCWKNGELDKEIPIFSKDRNYIEELIYDLDFDIEPIVI